MIKTQADLAKLTVRQREVLVALVRNLSREKLLDLRKSLRPQQVSTRRHSFRLTPSCKRRFQNWKARPLPLLALHLLRWLKNGKRSPPTKKPNDICRVSPPTTANSCWIVAYWRFRSGQRRRQRPFNKCGSLKWPPPTYWELLARRSHVSLAILLRPPVR